MIITIDTINKKTSNDLSSETFCHKRIKASPPSVDGIANLRINLTVERTIVLKSHIALSEAAFIKRSTSHINDISSIVENIGWNFLATRSTVYDIQNDTTASTLILIRCRSSFEFMFSARTSTMRMQSNGSTK